MGLCGVNLELGVERDRLVCVFDASALVMMTVIVVYYWSASVILCVPFSFLAFPSYVQHLTLNVMSDSLSSTFFAPSRNISCLTEEGKHTPWYSRSPRLFCSLFPMDSPPKQKL